MRVRACRRGACDDAIECIFACAHAHARFRFETDARKIVDARSFMHMQQRAVKNQSSLSLVRSEFSPSLSLSLSLVLACLLTVTTRGLTPHPANIVSVCRSRVFSLQPRVAPAPLSLVVSYTSIVDWREKIPCLSLSLSFFPLSPRDSFERSGTERTRTMGGHY